MPPVEESASSCGYAGPRTVLQPKWVTRNHWAVGRATFRRPDCVFHPSIKRERRVRCRTNELIPRIAIASKVGGMLQNSHDQLA